MFESTIGTVPDPLTEVARLQGLLAGAAADFPIEWRLTPMEETVVRTLLNHAIVTAEIIEEVSGTQRVAVRVHLHRIRKKLTPHGVEIETVVSKGWRLVGREHWRAQLDAQKKGA